MKKDKETVIKSFLLALSTAISAFTSAMLLNHLLKSINIGFWILFLILFLLIFELIFLCLVVSIGKYRYFTDLNNRITMMIQPTKTNLNEMKKTEKDRLKNIINVKDKREGEN